MNARRALIIGIFVALAVAAYALDLRQYLTLESLRDHRAALLAFVEVHGLGAALLFILAYTLGVAFSIPGATIMTLASGLLFGAGRGAFVGVQGGIHRVLVELPDVHKLPALRLVGIDVDADRRPIW